MKTAFPKWVVAATLASCSVLVVLCGLAAQMFAKERSIHRVQMQRKILVEQRSELLLNQVSRARGDDSSAKLDSDIVRRWEGVLAQVKHPYNKAQASVLGEELSDDSTDSSTDLEGMAVDGQRTKVVWSQLPVGLARFTLNNRAFFDSVYELLTLPSEDAWLSPTLASRGVYRVRELVLWDVANSLVSKDQERLAKSLEAYLRLSLLSGHSGVVNFGELISLLHLGLDEGLMDAKTVRPVLDRIAETALVNLNVVDPFGGDQETRMAFYYAGFSKQLDRVWMFPSLKESMFEGYCYRNNFGAKTVVDNDLYFVAALKFYTLAVRVALLEAIQEKHRELDMPGDVLSRLRLPSDLEGLLATKLNGNYLPSSLFSYEQKSPGVGELKFTVPRDISSGAFPIRTTYEVQAASVPK